MLNQKKNTLEDLLEFLVEEEEELKSLATALNQTVTSLQRIIDRAKRSKVKRSIGSCDQLLQLVERLSENLLNQENGTFGCLQQEAEDVVCNSSSKAKLKEHVEKIESASDSANILLKEKSEEIENLTKEVKEINDQLSTYGERSWYSCDKS